MTDKEIIKALECCEVSGTCEYCPLKSDKKNCLSLLSKNALDLIKRQQAEIDRLQEYHDATEGAIYSFREDHAKVKFFKKEIEVEAIKEFAERLKAISHPYGDTQMVFELQIDNLVKETVGKN